MNKIEITQALEIMHQQVENITVQIERIRAQIVTSKQPLRRKYPSDLQASILAMFRQQVKQGVTILELRCQLPVSSGKLIDMLRKIPNVFITGTGRKTDPFIYFIKGISEVPPDARPITRTIHFPPTPLTQPPSSL